jgi:hypothetical protein
MEKWGKDNHSIVYIKPSDKYVGFNVFLEQKRLIDSDELSEEYLENKILKTINQRYKKP